jgi:hypothetical protein
MAGDHTGDSLRTAGQKINSNFTELYGIVNSTALPARTGNNGKALFTDGTAVYWAPIVATNGVVTTGSYANPTWITNLAYGKITDVPTATASIAGVVKVDGTTININNGVISASPTAGSLTSGAYTVALSAVDGTLTLPHGQFDLNESYVRFKYATAEAGAGAQIGSPDDQNYVNVSASSVTIQVNSDSLNGRTQKNWIFDTTGKLTVPGSMSFSGSTSGSVTFTAGTTPAVQTYTLPSSYPVFNNYVLASSNSGVLSWILPTGSGTVSSVTLELPSQFNVTVPTVTTTGNLTATWNTQTANYVLAGPTTGNANAPTFRALVAADIPALAYQAPIGTISGLVKGNGANALTAATAGVDYQTAQSVTGIVKSTGTTRSPATAGTDYSAGTSALATGIVKSTTTTGALTIASGADINTTFGSQTQNYVYAAPSSGNGNPSFRLLTVTDMPISGLQSRSTASATTGSLAYQTSSTITIPVAKGYALYSIQSSVGSWVTIYTNSASMASDSARSISTDPTPGNGIVAESITTGASITVSSFSPAVIGYNLDSPVTTSLYMKVYNNSGSTGTVTVTLTYIKFEV